MQALRVLCKVLIINQLPHFFEINVHLDVNVCCYLRQMAVQSASSYSVICVKLPYSLHQVAPRLNRDCQMIGYILFYKLPVII